MRHLVFVAAASIFVTPGVVCAQGSSLFGGGSGGSGRGGGSSSQLTQPSTAQSLQTLSGGTTSGGGTSSGSSGGGGSFGSIGNSPTSMFGGSNQIGQAALSGGTGRLQGTQPFQFGQAGQSLSNIGFVGGNTSGNFVGSRQASQQAAAGLSAFQQAFQGMNRGAGGGRNGQLGGREQPKLGIRPTQRIAFNYPTSTPAATTSRVTTRLAEVIDRRPELSGVTASTDDAGRLILRGSVANDEARDLAAALVRLEPGVGEVVNELTVAAAESAP